MPIEQRTERRDYKFFHQITTRWMDNDCYGHVNNVTYYSFFDTAVASFLMSKAGVDPNSDSAIGLVVETGCQFYEEISFPDHIHVGLRLQKIGHSSVVYQIAIFKNNQLEAAAKGRFVHVYVDRQTRKPVSVPKEIRQALATIAVDLPC